ncbi:MAG: hypothetical protein WC812_01315 [Candidatus Pacearchaeota archaeon]|jgi:hypothetical protein
MKNYKLIANESYDMIGEEIDLQIRLNPRAREIKFIKVDGMQLMYDAYVLQGTDIPAIQNANFVDTRPRRELGNIINGELSEGPLPKEVRVICPNRVRDSWGIFFKR